VVTREHGVTLVHAMRTGWVSVKRAHREATGLDALRLLEILTDDEWTEWMPVIVYAIVHPEGVFLVDAGLSERSLAFDDPGCDETTRYVYENLLRFRFSPEDRIDRRLRALGIEERSIRAVVVTHLHADHVDALDVLPPEARVYVGAADWPGGHAGFLACRWPRDREPIRVRDPRRRADQIAAATPLTSDGALAIVPLPGHSPGHLGVLLRSGDADVLFAGDAAFELHQIETRSIAGIVADPDDARATLAGIADQLARRTTFLLPAHDMESLSRWMRGEPSVLGPPR
jgi:glyoxylase-like metal-dependent hydrolase (beta-lactamase superfamily II)